MACHFIRWQGGGYWVGGVCIVASYAFVRRVMRSDSERVPSGGRGRLAVPFRYWVGAVCIMASCASVRLSRRSDSERGRASAGAGLQSIRLIFYRPPVLPTSCTPAKANTPGPANRLLKDSQNGLKTVPVQYVHVTPGNWPTC